MFGYRRWRDARREQLAQASTVVETACGPMEFQCRGAAPWVLFLHGTPGGYDQRLASDPLIDAGFGMITVSRPGYLRTPLATGRTIAGQADACAALLDVLEVDQVVVHGASGGGPSAIQFAARHGARACGLMLSCAISATYRAEVPAWLLPVVMSPAVMRLQGWMLQRFPEATTRTMLKTESTFDAPQRARAAAAIAASPDGLALIRELIDSATPMEDRRAGMVNDLAEFAAIDSLPLESVACPAFIAHGAADGDVPFEHGENASRRIPDARLHRMDNGWHLLWLSDGADDMLREQVAFVRTCFNQVQRAGQGG